MGGGSDFSISHITWCLGNILGPRGGCGYQLEFDLQVRQGKQGVGQSWIWTALEDSLVEVDQG